MQMRMGDGVFVCALICDGMTKFLVNSMAFAFAPIGTWIDPLAAFAFVFRHMEAPEYVYILSQCLLYSYTACTDGILGLVLPHIAMFHHTF